MKRKKTSKLILTIPPCETIDEVIDRLDGIIAACALANSRLGYFAALYREVTVRVREGIAQGRFENGPRMERLDVVFANRYFAALDSYLRGEACAQCWSVAFHAAHRRPPIIFQHLLLGMNAHINLDLAVAAIQTVPNAELAGLKRDFFEITILLHELIDEIQGRIARVSPWIAILDRVGGRTDEQICAFAIAESRQLAWREAEALARLTPEELEREIETHDRMVANLGHGIRSPGALVNLGLRLIRVRESHPVPRVIAALQTR
jgi:hypothetical protein